MTRRLVIGMSRRIVIAGAGGFGRGIYSWLEQSPKHREDKDVQEVVFIDDGNPGVRPQAPVVGTVRDYIPLKGDEVLVAVGLPNLRKHIVDNLKLRAVEFHTFVDDRAVIAEGVSIGPGSIVCPGSVISADVTVGPHVHINFNCSIGHDTDLGEFTTLSPMSNIMGETAVGSSVFVGGSAVVLPRINIADGVTIGAGATVVQSVGRDRTVAGNPARSIREEPKSAVSKEEL